MNRNRVVWWIFLFLTLEALFSIPFLNIELALNRQGIRNAEIAIVGTLITCALLWFFRNFWSRLLQGLANRLEAVSSLNCFFVCSLVGIALRVLWVLAYPAPQHSDQATYFGLAQGLLLRHSYGVPHGGVAYWPPGYPLFLSCWFLVLGVKAWVPVVVNSFLFVPTLLVANRLAARVGGSPAGKFAMIFLTIWPTYVMTAGMASKEMLVLFLVPFALLLYTTTSATESFGAPKAILAGLFLGAASLTQPSLQLFLFVLVGWEWLRHENIKHAVGRTLLVAAAMVAVIFPWTLRNHRALGVWVPISSNGGDVFYRANNPLATGGYTPAGEQNLDNLDEITRGRTGMQLGKEWVRQNPGKFLLLALRKQVLFLGEDGHGAFETLKRGLNIGGIQYVVWKGVSNAFWYLIWALILLLFMTRSKSSLSKQALFSTLLLGCLYLYGIHSIFESGPKYHQPLMVFFAAIAAQVFSKTDPA
jgi:hypothetical protein